MDFFLDDDEPVKVPKVAIEKQKKVPKAKQGDWLKLMGTGVELPEVTEEVVKRKKIALFDFLGDINLQKRNILRNDPHAHVDYAPYIINIGMSLQADTLFYANEMNKFHFLPKQMQYDYLIKSVHARKRFGAWPKKFKESEDMELIKLHYGISSTRALEYLEFLSSEQIEVIKTKQFKGGSSKVK